MTQTRDRQPLRKGERQSGYSYVCFVKYSQFIDSLLLHISVTLRRRDTSVSRNSFTRCYRQFLRITIINNLYRMVRQGELPEGQEKVPWGATSAHRLYPVCTLYNRHVNSPFSIPNSQSDKRKPARKRVFSLSVYLFLISIGPTSLILPAPMVSTRSFGPASLRR